MQEITSFAKFLPDIRCGNVKWKDRLTECFSEEGLARRFPLGMAIEKASEDIKDDFLQRILLEINAFWLHPERYSDKQKWTVFDDCCKQLGGLARLLIAGTVFLCLVVLHIV